MLWRMAVCAILFCFFWAVSPAQALEKKLTMVFASQMGDIQNLDQKGGLAELATLLQTLRKTDDEVLFFHGGGAFGDFTLSAFDYGAHMVGLLNLVDPAVYAVAKNDFPHHKDTLSVRTRDAIFPFVSSNLVVANTMNPVNGVKSSAIVHAHSIPVGFFSLITSDAENTHISSALELLDQEVVFSEELTHLKLSGSALNVVVTDSSLAQISPSLEHGPDILFLTAEGATRISRHGETLVLHQREESSAFVVTAVFSDADGALKLLRTEAKIIDLATLQQNASMADSMSNYVEILEILLNTPVGHTGVQLETLEDVLNTRENAFASMVAEAMREYYGADIGVINSGFIRGNAVYPADTQLTRRDLHREFPLHGACEFVATSGRAIELMLENAVSEIEEPQKTGRFLHVSGLSFVFDPGAEKGARVSSIKINGEPLDKRKEYTLTISSHLGEGRNGFYMLKTSKRRYTEKPAQAVSEIVRNYIDRNSPVAPSLSGRITESRSNPKP